MAERKAYWHAYVRGIGARRGHFVVYINLIITSYTTKL